MGLAGRALVRVDRHVAVADDDRAPRREVQGVVGEVGVAVVPGDELRRGVRAREVSPGIPSLLPLAVPTA
jgi:hypothetical protein